MVMNMQANAAKTVGDEETVEHSFLKALSLLEQAHRRLHDVVKDNLERSGERFLTGDQALLADAAFLAHRARAAAFATGPP